MHRTFAVAAVLAAFAGMPSAVVAQPAQGQKQTAAQSRLRSFVAGEVTRIALMDIRGIQEPRASDYGVTVSILNLAQSLAPSDDSIARRRAEAAWLSGDSAELERATADIMRLDPRDTVAVLRFLTTRITAMQTADERLAAYDRAVASNLDPSIRSRMALDAALLLKERGDEAGFVARLKQAAQLDSTNKEAALLAYTFFAERTSDGMGRLELASNLLMADPLDVKTHQLIRDELARAGAFRGSSRFHKNISTISRAARLPENPADLTLEAIYKWRIDGVRATLDGLNLSLSEQRQNYEQISTMPGASYVKKPEDVRLSEPFEEVRLCAAIAAQRPNDIEASLKDMTSTLQRKMDLLKDPLSRGRDVTAEQASESLRLAGASQFVWQCLVAVLAPEGVAASAQSFQVIPEAADMPLVKGWQALRAKDYGAAKSHMDQAGDSYWALLGRAMILHKTVENGESARALSEFSQTAPLNPLGAMAADIARGLTLRDGGAAPLSDPAAIEAFVKGIPAWIDEMATRPHTFQAMRAEPAVNAAGNLDPIRIKVRIRNLSPIPLAVGSARTINSRLLFVPSMTRQGGAALLLEPEVIELDRRLRLMPNEEMLYEVWPEVGMVGFAVQQNSYFPSRLRWRVIQGFEATSAVERRPGLGSVESQIDTPVLHDALQEVRMKGDDLVNAIATADESKLPELVVAARVRLMIGADPALDRLVDALVRRYPTLSPDARLLFLSCLPASTRVPSLHALDAVIVADKDPRVLMLACLIRITAPDDPVLAATLASNEPAAIRVANGLKSRFDRYLKPKDATPEIAPTVPADQRPRPAPAPEQPAVGVPQPIEPEPAPKR